MNIPNDGGWGKQAGGAGKSQDGPWNGVLEHISGISRDWVILGCLGLTATLAFGSGLYVARQNQPSKDPLWIEQLPPEELPGSISSSTKGAVTTSSVAGKESTKTAPPAAAAAALPQSGNYIASKTGSKYYLPTCAAAKRIKDENKRWFATKQEAEAAGYQPAANCKGL